jgi:hypothetical protein
MNITQEQFLVEASMCTQRLKDRFKNGNERYYNDYVFRHVIDSLERGADPIQIIDELLLWCEDTRIKLEEYVVKGPSPKYIIADEETINKLKTDYEKDKGKTV